MRELIQILMAGIASLGFGIFFKIRSRYFPVIFLGGAISWIAYLIAFHLTMNDTVGMFVAAFAVALFAEIVARVMKTPSTMIYIPAIIPLIPGGNLYYCLSYFLQKNNEQAAHYGEVLFKESLAIVLGTIIVYGFVLTFITKRTSENGKIK